MRKYLHDPGVRAAAVSGITIATLAVFFADAYPAAWIALGVAWVAATSLALWWAHRKAAD
ncbi:hypothetical protein ACFP63_08580 [Oerskovia jenensis]|uniref:Uncharacterized protein n=1 Tax=Oerskovia jenensis TaxID=162169 RepID=A0ABS2LI59_9CELL|nr:hypothetical protein [Oerskovia jenensis]MBM7480106.1 hypothetical protein [Oerskovia jenensis]